MASRCRSWPHSSCRPAQLVDDLGGAAADRGPVGTDVRVEVRRSGEVCVAGLLHGQIVVHVRGPQRACPLGRLGDEDMAGSAQPAGRVGAPALAPQGAVGVEDRREHARLAGGGAHHQWQSVVDGEMHGLRPDAAADPERRTGLERPGLNGDFVQRRPELALPGDALLGPQPQQQLGVLALARRFRLRILVEHRVRLGEEGAARHEFNAAAGQQIDQGVVLGDQDRVTVGHECGAGGEPDRRRVLGYRCQHRCGRGDHIPLAEVVFPDGVPGEAGLLRLGSGAHHVPQPLLLGEGLARERVGEKAAESDEP